MLKRALLLLSFFASQLYGADDLSAIGFFDGKKVRIAFVRTADKWQSACYYETEDITEQASTEHCAQNLFDKSWDIIDYKSKPIKAGLLLWLGNFLSTTDFSFETPPKIKEAISKDAPKMYMWGGEIYQPLLVVPSGTEVKKMPTTIPKKIDQQLKSKLVASYLQKERKIYGCEKGTEKALSEKPANPKDVTVTLIKDFLDGYSFYELSLNLPQEAQYCGMVDSHSELFAIKNSKLINLSESFHKEHRPLSTGLSLWDGLVFPVGKKKETLFVVILNGYNLNGFALFDDQLRLLGSSV